MHYFESQLISTVKATEENAHAVAFSGHYRHGDGQSIPGFSGVLSFAFFYIYTLNNSLIIMSVALVLLVVTMFLLSYRKVITFNLDKQRIVISSRSLVGSKTVSYSFENARLNASKISIRLADDCGAMDLTLPDQTIRLSVDGLYNRTLEKAALLVQGTGIQLSNNGDE